jgi:hypothetical protein
MCTLTYIKTEKGFILTANRDESPLRNARSLTEYCNGAGDRFFIAAEPVHGGTNMAVGEHRISVLLNGAYDHHLHDPPYRKSRGLVLLDTLNLEGLDEVRPNMLEGVEPFTLVNLAGQIEVLRWDGRGVNSDNYDPDRSFVIASAQLYDRSARAKRERWFSNLLRKRGLGPAEAFEFHLRGGEGDPENDMVINRSGTVRTVSITQVVEDEGERRLRHLNLIDGKEERLRLSNHRFQ